MVSSLPPIFLALLIFFCLQQKPCNAHKYLKLPLHHKNPFTTPPQTLTSDTQRLFTLSSSFQTQKTLKTPVISGASTGSGQYFVDFNIGTPPQKLLLIADTGSDLIWVKCSPCRNCSRHPPGTAFLARHSKTFSPFHCYNRACRLVPPPPKPNPCNLTKLHSTCRYEYSYADTSKTSGFFSREIATLNASSGREMKLKNLAFGCGFHVSGPSVTGSSFNGAHGVMGLGRGPISFSSQVGKRFGNKFSYCLMDYTISPPPTSYLIIGEAHEPNSKKPMKFTPLHTNPLSPTFYYVGIESVSVNGVSLPIDPSVWTIDGDGNGGTVIDSGTTLTFLAEPGYRQILAEFKRLVRLPRMVGPDASFELCVNVSDVANPRLPRLVVRFLGGAIFEPPPRNYFIDAADGVKCLALLPVNSPSGFSVIGNLMQQGFLFEFDRDESRLGFTRIGCAVS
ncbi:eukaryotic aspartyl protease family protein [Tasmannia lanceolata]|uniref:eukaryotic aspartyl protease family protein n=1 Tax=Tasmannia lanceolata TaxID=3420 RepID=UPI0040631FDD